MLSGVISKLEQSQTTPDLSRQTQLNRITLILQLETLQACREVQPLGDDEEEQLPDGVSLNKLRDRLVAACAPDIVASVESGVDEEDFIDAVVVRQFRQVFELTGQLPVARDHGISSTVLEMLADQYRQENNSTALSKLLVATRNSHTIRGAEQSVSTVVVEAQLLAGSDLDQLAIDLQWDDRQLRQQLLIFAVQHWSKLQENHRQFILFQFDQLYDTDKVACIKSVLRDYEQHQVPSEFLAEIRKLDDGFQHDIAMTALCVGIYEAIADYVTTDGLAQFLATNFRRWLDGRQSDNIELPSALEAELLRPEYAISVVTSVMGAWETSGRSFASLPQFLELASSSNWDGFAISMFLSFAHWQQFPNMEQLIPQWSMSPSVVLTLLQSEQRQLPDALVGKLQAWEPDVSQKAVLQQRLVETHQWEKLRYHPQLARLAEQWLTLRELSQVDAASILRSTVVTGWLTVPQELRESLIAYPWQTVQPEWFETHDRSAIARVVVTVGATFERLFRDWDIEQSVGQALTPDFVTQAALVAGCPPVLVEMATNDQAWQQRFPEHWAGVQSALSSGERALWYRGSHLGRSPEDISESITRLRDRIVKTHTAPAATVLHRVGLYWENLDDLSEKRLHRQAFQPLMGDILTDQKVGAAEFRDILTHRISSSSTSEDVLAPFDYPELFLLPGEQLTRADYLWVCFAVVSVPTISDQVVTNVFSRLSNQENSDLLMMTLSSRNRVALAVVSRRMNLGDNWAQQVAQEFLTPGQPDVEYVDPLLLEELVTLAAEQGQPFTDAELRAYWLLFLEHNPIYHYDLQTIGVFASLGVVYKEEFK